MSTMLKDRRGMGAQEGLNHSVREIKNNPAHDAAHAAVVSLALFECGIPRDTAMSLIVNNWTGRLNVPVSLWAAVKGLDIATVTAQRDKGFRLLNEWYKTDE